MGVFKCGIFERFGCPNDTQTPTWDVTSVVVYFYMLSGTCGLRDSLGCRVFSLADWPPDLTALTLSCRYGPKLPDYFGDIS